ncbi:MAG: thiol peroxidase [Proteobacteria bacterium]|nr:thiol peroxidase [Pseudomonadota bacterium]
MAKITLKGNVINTLGDLPAVGSKLPDFNMVKSDLSETNLYSIKAAHKILNIFPSVDTGVCASSVRTFNKRASELDGALVLCISKDLPFALKRFCGAEGIDKVETVSVFRSDFSKQLQLEITDGPLKGLCSRSVIVLDADNKVLYREQVAETTQEPDYEAALKSLR